MIVKGIIKSIDYTGNTCTVRIPVFESAANENEVVVPATLSTLPGIYNGYKEEDVVFITFENNDYDMPIVIGKLYLGVENEKNDPRGAIVCNNITAAQPISIPISSQLTLDNDPQHSTIVGVDNGIDSYKSIADLAKNLQKQDEKIGSLSVKVIDDGENLGAEIAKKVSVTDEATKQRGLGWNLNTEKWEIYAKDTVGDNNSLAKLPIMTIDRTGMVISGNLVLTGYPQTTEIKYTNSTDKNTPPTGDDVKWQDNTKDLYTDEHYIWKRTREVFYAYNAETDKWELTKYGDAHYECITGAKGDAGYTTVTVILYKRSKTPISDNPISDDLYYKFSDQKLYTDDTCTTDYTLPEGWSYTISGAGDSSNGDLYCIAAVANSNTDSDSIPASEWAGPTLYVENGVSGTSVAQLTLYQRAASTPNNPTKDGTWTYKAADGSLTCNNEATAWKPSIPSGTEPCYESHAAVLVTGLDTTTVTEWSEPAKFVENGAPGIGITSLKTYYLMQSPTAVDPEAPTQGQSVPSDSNWKETPDVYIDGYVYWLTTQTIYSDGRISYSDPVKDNGLDGVYEIAQGRSKNYYGGADPADGETAKAKMRQGDGWFDTAYRKIDKPTTSTGYLQKYIKEQNTEKYILITSQNITEYISDSDPTKWPDAYSGPTLYQWSANGKDGHWEDVGGELIANKVTANYINALDITTKKITVLQDAAATIEKQKILFEADGTNATGKVKIADFDVNHESLYSFSDKNGYELNIRSAGKIEKNEEITIDDTYMTWKDILVPKPVSSQATQQTQQTPPQLIWEQMKKWPKNGRYPENDNDDGVAINDESITNNYTLLHLNTPETGQSDVDVEKNIWLKPQGYISFLKISIEKDILDFNAWIGIISSSSKLNNSDYLSSQDTIRLFSSMTDFKTWDALKTELDKFKSGSASQLSELGYCRPAIGDETSKMPTSVSLTDNLVKFSWGNLSAGTYLYCVVENNYQRDFVISNSSESGQDTVIEHEDAYGNIHTIIVPAGTDAKNVPGYLQAFLILDKTFTKYGAAISAGYNGEDFILTGDGKVIASNILITGGAITADSGNIGPLEISAGEINTAGFMINKSSTHIKNGASLKILGTSGNTTKPIAKLSKNGFIISAQGLQAENNKYFNYKIGEVSGSNDTPNTPGLLWKQRDIDYSTVYVKADLNRANKTITFTLYSDSARTTEYDTKLFPDNKTLDVTVYLKYAKKIIQKRKISRPIKINVDGNNIQTDFITLPTQLITTISPVQFKFKKGDASSQEVLFANINIFDKIYGISSTKGGALQAETLEFTMSAPTSINALDPNLYITSSILPASTFKKDGSVIKETKNEYDLGSSTYPWNNVYSKYFYGVSDRREKTDITPLSEQNNLDEFYNKLKPVSFSFKSSNDTLHFGLIAQDVDEASAGLPTDKPLAIVNKSDPNCLSIDYQELIAVNILKIQQLSKKIDSLEAEIKCLKGED